MKSKSDSDVIAFLFFNRYHIKSSVLEKKKDKKTPIAATTSHMLFPARLK
jgi:hypothetical protein